MIQCQCGKEYSEEFLFCPYCGLRKPEPKTENKCMKCGETFPLDFVFCPKCGIRFDEETAPEPTRPEPEPARPEPEPARPEPEPVRPEPVPEPEPPKAEEKKQVRYCWVCHAVLEDGMEFCGVCGAPVKDEGSRAGTAPGMNGQQEQAYSAGTGAAADSRSVLLTVENVSFLQGELKGMKDFYSAQTGSVTFYGDRLVFLRTGSRKGELIGSSVGGLLGAAIGRKQFSASTTELYYGSMSDARTVPYPPNRSLQMILVTCNGAYYTIVPGAAGAQNQNAAVYSMMEIFKKYISRR